MKTQLLKFGKGNAKLNGNIYTFSIPAGHSCPFALDCLSKSDRETGKITDGKKTEFRCFSASLEAIYKNTREARWHNFDLLRNSSDMAKLIQDSLPKNATMIRIHVGGDFFNQKYFNAWLTVAKNNPNIIFYAYTKSIGYWANMIDQIPFNFKLNGSKGGKQDNLINKFSLKFAEVVFSLNEAKNKGLKIDHTDELAYNQDKSFALLIHGTQAKGSKAAAAIKELKSNKVKFSYSK